MSGEGVWDGGEGDGERRAQDVLHRSHGLRRRGYGMPYVHTEPSNSRCSRPPTPTQGT